MILNDRRLLGDCQLKFSLSRFFLHIGRDEDNRDRRSWLVLPQVVTNFLPIARRELSRGEYYPTLGW